MKRADIGIIGIGIIIILIIITTIICPDVWLVQWSDLR